MIFRKSSRSLLDRQWTLVLRGLFYDMYLPQLASINDCVSSFDVYMKNHTEGGEH